MLLSRDAITAAVEAHVEASDYYKPAHVHIHEAIMALYGQGEPVDPVTIAEELRRAELLDAVGGRAALAAHPGGDAGIGERRPLRRIVNELALLRRLIGVAGDIAEMGYDTPEDVAETLDRAESMVFEVAERRVSESLAGISDSLQTTLDQLESMYGSDNEVVGVPSGYHELDSLLLGLQRSNLVIVAARPSMGKCVAWDTPIVDASTGSVRTAQEVYERGRAGRPGTRARARRRPARSQHRTIGVRGRRREARLQDHDPYGTRRPHHDHAPVPDGRWLEAAHRHLRRRPSPCLVRSECSETNRAPKRRSSCSGSSSGTAVSPTARR